MDAKYLREDTIYRDQHARLMKQKPPRSVTKVITVDPQVLGDPQVLKVIPRF